jgi:hypothetical protein
MTKQDVFILINMQHVAGAVIGMAKAKNLPFFETPVTTQAILLSGTELLTMIKHWM